LTALVGITFRIYVVKSHAVQHALKEGFERKQMVEAIFSGKIIEAYPDDQRVLICESVGVPARCV